MRGSSAGQCSSEPGSIVASRPPSAAYRDHVRQASRTSSQTSRSGGPSTARPRSPSSLRTLNSFCIRRKYPARGGVTSGPCDAPSVAAASAATYVASCTARPSTRSSRWRRERVHFRSTTTGSPVLLRPSRSTNPRTSAGPSKGAKSTCSSVPSTVRLLSASTRARAPMAWGRRRRMRERSAACSGWRRGAATASIASSRSSLARRSAASGAGGAPGWKIATERACARLPDSRCTSGMDRARPVRRWATCPSAHASWHSTSFSSDVADSARSWTPSANPSGVGQRGLVVGADPRATGRR